MTDDALSDERDLADALAERALARAAGSLAAAAVVLGVLAAVFLVLADGALDVRSLPQVVLLSAGQVVGLALAALALTRLRSVRSVPGGGPSAAAVTAAVLDRVVVAVPVGGAVVAVVLVVVLAPRTTAALSAVVGLALLAQLSVLAAVLRRPLRRAARAP